MKKNATLTLAALLITTAVSGCSGGRLRNLISRSDYMTLEEAEKQDALTAERENAADEKAFANAERELSDDNEVLVSDKSTAEAGEPEKRSPFSLAGLFRRGDRAQEEVTPDPFEKSSDATAEEASVVKVAADEQESDATSEETEADQLVAEAATSEKKSMRELFEERTAEVETKAGSELRQAMLDQEEDPLPESFADYMKANRDRLEEGVEATVVESGSLFEEVENTVIAESNEAAQDFDAILNQIADVETPAAADELTSGLFPGIDAVVDASESQVPAIAAAPPETADRDVEVTTTASLFEEITSPQSQSDAETSADPFSEASEKHGFQKLAKSDPWAAFDKPSSDQPTAVPDAGFVWNEAQSQPQAPETVPDGFDWAALQSEDDASQTALTQVSPVAYSSKPQAEFMEDTFSQDDAGSQLVIPVNSAPAPIQFDDTFPQLNDAGAPANEPVAEPAAADPGQPAIDVTDQAVGSTARWSTRTWFLVIGCALVVGMLLMPERKNRANA